MLDLPRQPSAHVEPHLSMRTGWLRAAVMGANDGVLSTASLIVGVAAGSGDRTAILLAGVAGMVAGAMSMAAGEYVSVSSQSDTERADIAQERHELQHHADSELAELAAIYEHRGLSPDLARQVAEELTEKDALAAHLRDEIGITDLSPPRPVQAALVSALTFAIGAAAPLIIAAFAPIAALSLVGRGGDGSGAGHARRARGAGRRRAETARGAARGRLGRAGDGGDLGHRWAGRSPV